MKNTVCTEIGKAFRTKGFLISLFIGFSIVFIHLGQQFYIGNLNDGEDVIQMGIYYTGSCFGQWMAMDATDLWGRLFTFLIPLIATLPYATSYTEDRQSGYLLQVVGRTDYRQYLLAKYAAVVVSGMVAVMLPLATDLLALALKSPMRHPFPGVSTATNFECGLIHLYYQHPIMFSAFYICLDGMMGGLIASLSLMPASLNGSRFSVWAFPMVVCLVANNVLTPILLSSWNPIHFLHPAYMLSMKLIPVLTENLLMVVLVLAFFCYRLSRKELL